MEPTQDKRIPEFFRGRSVFITGGTGFMGKVLVEKLLRSCPELQNVYIILRAKKGKTPIERLHDIFSLPLFERLNREQPEAIKKMVLLEGDMMKLGLGLNANDTQALLENVSVVFHVAATVKFDDPIKSAIFMNVRGTREVFNLASRMTQLNVVVHVSTTYCNTDRVVIDEQLYPAPADWTTMITAAETLDEYTLDVLTSKLLGVRPNTYTYTKALGEHVVDSFKNTVPAVVFRPSVVISSRKEPMPGWMDNFNGPVGLMVAGGKGILRTMYANPENTADYMAVDVAIKAMIIAAWDRGRQSSEIELPVYNCASSNVKSLSIAEINKVGYSLAHVVPLNTILWMPGGDTSHKFLSYYIKVMLLHILPALLVDSILYMLDKKPMLVRLQRRIFIANIALTYFLFHEWKFLNDKFLELDVKVLPEDKEDWGFDFTDIDIRQYLQESFIGARAYLLKENISTLPEAKIHFNRMYWLDKVTRTTFFAFLLWKVCTSAFFQNGLNVLAGYLSNFFFS